jgi:lysophospholipase L1-like esterase
LSKATIKHHDSPSSKVYPNLLESVVSHLICHSDVRFITAYTVYLSFTVKLAFMKKRILCYGDSNTWGSDPDPTSDERFDENTRWTGVLANELGSGYSIIEEALSGRTTVRDDPTDLYRNGKDYLPPCLLSQRPLDLVVLMLGTNDLKTRFNVSAWDIADGIRFLGNIVLASQAGRSNKAPQLLIMAPPPLITTNLLPHFTGAVEKSEELAKYYAEVAQEFNCHFLNAGDFARTSELDGVHWEASEHTSLGKTVAEFIKGVSL